MANSLPELTEMFAKLSKPLEAFSYKVAWAAQTEATTFRDYLPPIQNEQELRQIHGDAAELLVESRQQAPTVDVFDLPDVFNSYLDFYCAFLKTVAANSGENRDMERVSALVGTWEFSSARFVGILHWSMILRLLCAKRVEAANPSEADYEHKVIAEIGRLSGIFASWPDWVSYHKGEVKGFHMLASAIAEDRYRGLADMLPPVIHERLLDPWGGAGLAWWPAIGCYANAEALARREAPPCDPQMVINSEEAEQWRIPVEQPPRIPSAPVMSQPSATSQAQKPRCKKCGAEILATTAEATGGFCRNSNCSTSARDSKSGKVDHFANLSPNASNEDYGKAAANTLLDKIGCATFLVVLIGAVGAAIALI